MSRCCVKDSRLASGTPYAADSSNPLAQIASNPASSASRADSGLCAAIAVASPPATTTLSRNGLAIYRRPPPLPPALLEQAGPAGHGRRTRPSAALRNTPLLYAISNADYDLSHDGIQKHRRRKWRPRRRRSAAI